MSKITASAAGEAMPATDLTQSRRGLLTALATAPLLGVVAVSATAKPETSPLPATSQTDGAMFELRDKLAEVRQQIEAIMDPHTEAELAMAAHHLPQPERTKPVGYDEWNKEWLELLKSHYKREPRLSDEEKRKDEAAMKAWKAGESRWRRKTGLRQVEAEMLRLQREEDAITDAMIDLPAFSVAALKAKLTALQDDCDYPKLNDAILRDLTRMTGLPHLRISE